MLTPGSSLFGTANRTRLLVALALLEESWPSELALLLGMRLYSVQSILAALEREGVVVSRLMGRTRRVGFSPTYFARQELKPLLWKLGQADVELQQALAARRRRPRRAGKAGLV